MQRAPIISKKSLNELQEYFVTWGTLRTIEQEFDAADIPWNRNHTPNVGGERRTLVQQYYASLDLTEWADARKLMRVFESVLSQLAEAADEQSSSFYAGDQKQVLAKLTKCLKRDGFIYKDGVLSAGLNAPGVDTLSAVAAELDAEHLMRQLRTMQEQVDANPGLAIGQSKELVETVCKTILTERGVDFDESATVQQLVKLLAKELKLTRDDIPDAAKGAETIKRVLSNLATIAQGLAEIRNLYGSGHGKHATAKGLEPRHARLAVGAASALTSFLFETHRERDQT